MLLTSFLVEFLPNHRVINLHPTLSKNKSKPVNVMTCHEYGEPTKVDEDECEEYDEETMMPEHLTEDLR